MKWTYGNSWEKYPIKENEVWKYNNSYISVYDIRNTIPSFIENVDLIYCDPPWNQGNANSFITKAYKNTYINSFSEFYIPFFKKIKSINAKIIFLEIGKQNIDLFKIELYKLYKYIQIWQITYYKKYPCFLICGCNDIHNYNYTGIDDSILPNIVINNIKNCNIVLDLCTGKGLTGIAAHKYNKQFYGLELNKRRLACFIDKMNGKYKYAYTLS